MFLYIFFFFFYYRTVDHRDLHSFPTRRSSDLDRAGPEAGTAAPLLRHRPYGEGDQQHHRGRDRKSTRLNSSHSQISYAVFCLKKKKIKKKNTKTTQH